MSKKSIIALLLALVMIFAVGCGDSGIKSHDHSSKDKISETKGDVSDEDTGDKGEPDDKGDTSFDIGHSTGGTYTNAFFGIGCTLDSGWTFYSDEQIAEINKSVSQYVEGYEAAMEKGASITDMYASSADGYKTINIAIENTNATAGRALGASEYIDIVLNSGNLEASLTNAGASNVSTEKVSVTFAGRNTYGILMSAELNGIQFYEVVVCIDNDGYIGAITFCSYYDDSPLEDMIGYFYALG